MNDLLLSIIIPVYDVEIYLKECLDSVFMQNIKKCEVICINDGSPDDSGSILEEYRNIHENLKIINRSNGGLSAARNSGLNHAKGEFIFFLDSDDYLVTDNFQKSLDFSVNGNLDIACFNANVEEKKLYFDTASEITTVLEGKEYYIEFYRRNGFFPPSPVWMYIYKRSFLEQNNLRFKEGYLHEDELFSPIVFYLAAKVQFSNIPLVYYRKRIGTITSALKEKNITDLAGICDHLYNFFNDQNCSEPLFYILIFELYKEIIYDIKNGCYEDKINTLLKENNINIMRLCALNEPSYKIYWYFCHNNKISNWINNTNFRILKKILNRLISLYFYLFLKRRKA